MIARAAPEVRGWCPGALTPMVSGDGLVIRVRPRLARLSATQVQGLCDVARRFGNGFIDLTNRANLQIRGVAEDQHQPVLDALHVLGLLDDLAEVERRRNLLVTPFWRAGDLTTRLAGAVTDALLRLPDLPAKVGFAIDTGDAPQLPHASADFRFERGDVGLILRADGANAGRAIDEDTAIPALLEMAAWFDAHRSAERRRMAAVVAHTDLPANWCDTPARDAAPTPVPGTRPEGQILGAPFGQIDAHDLSALFEASGAAGLRITPWRLFLLEGGTAPPAAQAGFITDAGDPLLTTDACPGAPFCPQASVATRDLARALAPRVQGRLHVSGCVKSCAHRGVADLTLIGRDGKFDLVEKGHAWDAPTRRGLDLGALIAGDDV